LGGIIQAVFLTVLLIVVQPPQLVYLLTPAVAGIVGAVSSDRFQSEYIETPAGQEWSALYSPLGSLQ
jgi:hypothetical protein